jgi:hypothetical protein
MRKLIYLAALMLSLCIATWATAQVKKDNGDLTIAGVGTVPAPAEGYQWKMIQASDETATPLVAVFVASKTGATGQVILVVERTSVAVESDRQGRIKGEYEAIPDGLKSKGYTDVKVLEAAPEPPVGSHAAFAFTGADKAGKAKIFRTAVFFGKNVFHFTVCSDTDDEAKALAKVADSVAETGAAPTTQKDSSH